MVALWALMLLLAACSAKQAAPYKVVSIPSTDDPTDVFVYELPNGLRVYISPNAEEPRFYSEIAVRVGSKNDPADTTGLAHYLEHLLFKGTQRLGTLDYEAEKPLLDEITALYEQHFVEEDPARRAEIYDRINLVANQAAQFAVPNEFDSVYSGMGGRGLNAHTWREETVYKIDLPSNRLEQWAVAEADRWSNPVFRIFHTELETVYEEKNRSLDDKNDIIFEAVNEALYQTHPYRQTVLGSTEHLKKPSIQRIYDYFNTWYVPNNMAILISGDVDPEETIRVIAKHFSGLEAKPLPPGPALNEPPLDSVRRVTVNYPGEEYVLMAFRTAPYGHEDTWALQVLDMTLNNQKAGLIDLNLNQAQLVREAGSFPLRGNDYGSQFLFGVPREGQTLAEVEELLMAQLQKIKDGEVEDWLLEAIVNDFRKSQEQSFESNTGRVAAMRDAFIGNRSWLDARHDLDRLAAVTREDVMRVANKYFSGGHVVGYRVDGPANIASIEKPRIDPLAIDAGRRSAFGQELLAMPTEPIEPRFLERGVDVQVVELSSGRKLYYSQNPVNNLFQFQVVVEKGSDHDNRLGLATRLMDKAGTARLAPDELKKEWYRLGTDFSIGATGNQTLVTIAGLDKNFQESLTLLREVLSQPSVSDEALTELVSVILNERETEKKNPQSVHAALVRFNRWGEESPYREAITAEELQAATVADLLGLVRDIPRTEHAITYVGPLDIDDVKEALERSLPAAADGLKPAPAYRFRTARKVDETEILFIDQKTAQSQIRIEAAGPVFDPDRRLAVELFNDYFGGGMSAVVFQEIREARALAYAAGATYATGSRTGEEDLMIGALGTQVDKSIEALEAMLDLMDNPPSDEQRFNLSLNALENTYRTTPIGFRGRIGAVRSWERLELEGDPRAETFAALSDAELDLMMAFHRETIKGTPRLISIVGDSDRIDMEALANFGKVITLNVDDVFPR
jgi:predicted Zn-dependent peptidase